MTGIPTDCTRCALPLDARNITGICLECKHILRDARAGYTAAEVPLDIARAAFMAVFTGYRKLEDTSTIYMRGACRRCARFVARRDTGCCEWFSGPVRFPQRRRKKPTKRPKRPLDGSVPQEIPPRASMHRGDRR